MPNPNRASDNGSRFLWPFSGSLLVITGPLSGRQVASPRFGKDEEDEVIEGMCGNVEHLTPTLG